MAADSAPGVAVHVIVVDPTADMDIDTADGLLPVVAGFDPTSAWGGGDDATAVIHDFDSTSVWGDGDAVTAAAPGIASADIPGSVTKKRRQQHNRATQDSRKHRRRVEDFAAARGGTPGSGPGPIEGHQAGDRAEWWRG